MNHKLLTEINHEFIDIQSRLDSIDRLQTALLASDDLHSLPHIIQSTLAQVRYMHSRISIYLPQLIIATRCLSDLPRDIILFVFAWIDPRVSPKFRRLSKDFNRVLNSTNFAQLNLNYHKALALDYSLDQCWWVWPADFQTVFAKMRYANIQQLDVGYYVFPKSARIPAAIGSLTCLTRLRLSGMRLRGGLPLELFELLNLTRLNLSRNLLEGAIPDEFQKLPHLETLELFGNHFSGLIPQSLSLCKELTSLVLSHNDFQSSVPEWLGSLGKLEILDLANNLMEGNIPKTLGNAAQLQTIKLSNNKLVGAIPEELCKLANLRELLLANNAFEGNIPQSINALSSLKELTLTNNSFCGSIPPEFVGLQQLTTLHLEKNQFNGSLPEGFEYMAQLKHLFLDQSGLEVEITRMKMLILVETDILDYDSDDEVW